MSAEVTTGSTFKAGAARTLFQVPIFGEGAALTNHYWDVSSDGQRFLINTVSPNARC